METKEYRLGDVCKLRNGYAFKSENFSTEGVHVIRISNIGNGEVTTEDALKTPESSVFEKFRINKGDILIAMSGATTGKFGRYLSDEKAYQNQRVGCFVIQDETKLNIDYLFVLLKGLQKRIELDAYGGGQPNISSSIIENYKVQLPLLDVQIRIARILFKAESLIKQRERSIQLLDDFLRMKFMDSFGDNRTNPKGYDKYPLEKLVAKDCPLTYGIVQPGEEISDGVPIVRPVDLSKKYIGLENLKKIDPRISSNFKRTILKGNEILLCVRGTTGVLSISKESLKGSNVTRGITPIWFDDGDIPLQFAFYLLNSEAVQQEIQKYTYGIALKQINLSEVRKLQLIKPPLEEQMQFNRIAIQIDRIKSNYDNSLNSLTTLYYSLSQKALKGELELSDTVLIDGILSIQPKITTEVITNTKNKPEVKFDENYLKNTIVKVRFKGPFTFDQLWNEITKFPFESVPEYDEVANLVFKWLSEKNSFIRQQFNTSTKQIELVLNETAKT